jgi:ABC-2 type transport system ATP-binding protein
VTAETPVVDPPVAVATAVVEERLVDAPLVEDPLVEDLIVEDPVVEDTVVEDLVVEAPFVAPAPAPAKRPVTRKPTTPAKTPAKTPVEAPTKATTKAAARKPVPESVDSRVVLELHDLVKRFGDTVAVDHVSLSIPTGSIFGIVGPNGAGKTTTLSMVTGLLRPGGGTIAVHGADVWTDPVVAKRNMGVLPDRLRLFDRLTGGQLLYYAGILRGLDPQTVKKRSADLASAFGLEDALDRLVADYSAGMTKKVALASAMIHSPRLLILDEPFESVDPVSAANVTEILQNYAAAGGTVVLSSHSMDLVQRICDHVAIVVSGSVLASGTMDEVRGIGSLEERFVELAGGRKTAEGMEWLHSFSD